MSADEEKLYMKYCKYDKESKEVILELVSFIEKQQEEIEELKQDYTKDWEDRCNLVYKELNAKIELQDKILRLMVSDFQSEGYFKDMKYESVIEYYKRRKDVLEGDKDE